MRAAMIKMTVISAIAVLIASPAAAVNYITHTSTYTGLGDTIGSDFDKITLNGVTGSGTGPGTYVVNTVDFVVGINSKFGGTYTGNFIDSATVGTTSITYSVPYTLKVGATDSITIGGNSTRIDGVRVRFNPLTFTNVNSTATGDLTATVFVPEPASWAMMAMGFGLIGFAVRRRRLSPDRYTS